MLKKRFILLQVLLLVCGIGVFFYKIGQLPIFADEAIYIRWAQLILDDPGRYAFFALNDGKTPLFIWLLTPFQLFISDQLIAARTVAAIIGLLLLFVSQQVLAKMKASRGAQLFGMLLFTLLPFWYLHARLALMDGLLTVSIALSVWTSLLLVDQLGKKRSQLPIKQILVAGLSLGFALLVKIPAILAFPSIFLLLLIQSGPDKKNIISLLSSIGVFSIAGLVFSLLAFHPAFPQLFSRGSDFLYPVTDVFGGVLADTLKNIPVYVHYFIRYLSPALLVTVLAGLFRHPKQKQVHLFFWLGLLFAVPILLLGKVVYPRYLLPAAWFITISGVLAFDGLIQMLRQKLERKETQSVAVSMVGMVIIGLLLANTVIYGTGFIVQHLRDVDKTPFVSADYEQFLTKWSSGHGIIETIALMRTVSKDSSVAVATEGYFGTLPDALLVYLHRTPVDNLYVEGIGQPVEDIPETFISRAQAFDQIWLVVNEHRLKMNLGQSQLLAEYCRPQAAPCLQVWDITELVK